MSPTRNAPTAPDLSVVVPWVNGADVLCEALNALRAQDGPVEVEVIVAERGDRPNRGIVEHCYPEARLISLAVGTPIPRMREAAFKVASGDSVAVIEDHVVVPRNWASSIVEAHRSGCRVIGGSVYNLAVATPLDRAAFLVEYSQAIAPVADGPVTALPGNNVSYQRDLLVDFAPVIAEGGWEGRLHQALVERGVTLTHLQALTAGHRMHFDTTSDFVAQRFHFSRALMSDRLRGRNMGVRILFAIGTVLLPPLLLSRILGSSRRGGISWAELAALAPYLILFVSVWALGETVGALFGPGTAPGRVR